MPDEVPTQMIHDEVPSESACIHVSGLPADFKERELFLLLRNEDGFRYSYLKHTAGKMTLAFAQFSTILQAESACNNLNELIIDQAFKDQKIHVKVAASNMKKPPEGRVGSNLSQQQRYQGGRMPFTYSSYSPPFTTTHQHQHHLVPHGQTLNQPAGYKHVPPCCTLFVSNIDSRMSDKQLTQLFSSFNGFNKITRPQANSGNKAWVDFTTQYLATMALQSLDGYHNGTFQPLKITYAKTETKIKSAVAR